MSIYTAPLQDMRFILDEIAGLDEISSFPGCEEATPEMASAILEEAGKFASAVLAPLNRVGDTQGCRLEGGKVTTPEGWKSAYDQFREAAWGALAMPVEFGGQGLPKLISAPVNEIWASANLAFSLLLPLSSGASEALLLAASDEIKDTYLHKLVSGEWTGTMALTEPQAGSDLSAVRTRADPQPDGSYRISGQKIFITYGEHDLAGNIIHLLLARLPDAPEGVKGISLFVVPKLLVDKTGEVGKRNDVNCVSIEHKMGIHGSPTCVLAYGDSGGAVGYLVGEPNRGLEYMFVMMNEARFLTGLQGIAIGERSYQHALNYAGERVQGRDAVTGHKNVPIIRHPDVQRMLLTMRAKVMAARMLAYSVAGMFDRAHHHPDKSVAQQNERFVDLLIPVVKGWSAEIGNEVVSIGVQIHGGMGFIEETGAAQHMRDARIISIYEGTTGIQANDLIGRKILREGGATLTVLIGEMRGVCEKLAHDKELSTMGEKLEQALVALESTQAWIVANGKDKLAEVLAGAVPFLHLTGIVCGGWQFARAALAARQKLADNDSDSTYYRGIIGLARFYFAHIAPHAQAYAETVTRGGAEVAGNYEAALGL